MFRPFTLVALVILLAACTAQGDGQSTESPNPSAPDASASASSAPAGDPSAACAEAFAPLSELGLTSTSDLAELAEIEMTIQNCESIADWTAGAQQVVENEIRPGARDILLGIRCEDGSLSRAPICEEL